METEDKANVNVQQVEQPVAPASLAQDGEKNLLSELADDLNRTMPKAQTSPVKPTPVAGEQEEEETVAELDPSEPGKENDPSPAEQEPETQQESPKSRTQKRFNELLAERKTLKSEVEELRAKAAENAARFMQANVPQTKPKEQTSDFWANEYNRLQEEGASTEKLNEAANNYHRIYRDEIVETAERQRYQKEVASNQQKAFVNSMFEIHENNPFIVPAENALGFDIDPKSELANVMVKLATQDGIPLAGNPVALLHYAQRADAMLLRQNLNGTKSSATNLKRQQAEAAAKGLVPGSRKAPPQPQPAKKRLDSLEDRAYLGDRKAAKVLAAESIAADFGL